MKFRLVILVFVLPLLLVSCSLSEDITPPPGYASPTAVPVQLTDTPIVEPTWTTEPVTPTPEATSAEATSAVTQSATSSASATAMTGTFLGSVTGTLVNKSGGGIPDGQNVTLIGLDQDKTGSYQKVLEKQSSVNHDGSYTFSGVEISANRAFIIVTGFGGVEYQSDPVVVKDATTTYTIPISIYEKTNDYKSLTVDQVHLKFDTTTQNSLQVTELFIVTNPGNKTVMVTSNGSTVPFLQIPAQATGLQYQLVQGSAPLMNATGGFAMLPGTDKQYGFLASFVMPYSRSLKYEQLFILPVSSLTVFLPQGMRISGKQLTAAGPQTIQNQIYQMYQSNNMAAGSTLSVALSGKPGESAGFSFNRQTIILISIVVVGILFIGAGIYLYLHDRARFLREVTESQAGSVEVDALGEDRDAIMDAMIALDDEYRAGGIPKDAYEARRSELKERLKGALSSQD